MAKKLSNWDLYPTESVRFRLDDDYLLSEYDLQLLRERLGCFGVDVYAEGNIVELWFEADRYIPAKTRNAGARPIFPCKDIHGQLAPVTYADIIYWKYGCRKTWTEVASLCNMSRATIFRQKPRWNGYIQKCLRLADRNRLDDLKYLQSIPELYTVIY